MARCHQPVRFGRSGSVDLGSSSCGLGLDGLGLTHRRGDGARLFMREGGRGGCFQRGMMRDRLRRGFLRARRMFAWLLGEEIRLVRRFEFFRGFVRRRGAFGLLRVSLPPLAAAAPASAPWASPPRVFSARRQGLLLPGLGFAFDFLTFALGRFGLRGRAEPGDIG